MSDRYHLHTVLYRISENQAQIACSIAELANWVDHCGQAEIANRVRTRLVTLLDNADAIGKSISALAKSLNQPPPDARTRRNEPLSSRIAESPRTSRSSPSGPN